MALSVITEGYPVLLGQERVRKGQERVRKRQDRVTGPIGNLIIFRSSGEFVTFHPPRS